MSSVRRFVSAAVVVAVVLVVSARPAAAFSGDDETFYGGLGGMMSGVGLMTSTVGLIGGSISLAKHKHRLAWAIVNDVSVALNLGGAAAWTWIAVQERGGWDGDAAKGSATLAAASGLAAASSLGLAIAGHVLDGRDHGNRSRLQYSVAPLAGRDSHNLPMAGIAFTLRGF